MSNEGEKGQKAMKTINEERRPSTSTSSAITCYFCKKPNHIKKKCRKFNEWKKKNPGHKTKKMNEDDHEGTYSDDDEGAACHVCFRVSVTDKDPSWYIDSGATTHMCSDKIFFTYIDGLYNKGVALANGKKLSIAGIGEGFTQCITETMKI